MLNAARTKFSWLVGFSLFWTGIASATTIDPLLFEELVLGADFVGIVECEQAGGIVARYRIIESWKGPEAGSRISIRVAVNYWEPQFPIALCGERYFMTAYKEAPSNIASTTSGGGVPLWWRNIPADYQLPLFQGEKLLATGEEKTAEFEKTTRRAARALLALKPAEQETALLRVVIGDSFFGEDKYRGGESDEAKIKELRARFENLGTSDALVGELLRLAQADPEKWAVRARIVLRKAGRDVALNRLEKLPADQSPWKKSELDDLVHAIKQRCGSAEAQQRSSTDANEEEKPLTEVQLAAMRKTFAAGPNSEGFDEAFMTLIRHDPRPVAEFLVTWKSPEKTDFAAYGFGSYFAWKCGKDRRKHLSMLLEAKEPFVRVAGAVYLCFEDTDAGMAALNKLTILEGDAGVWAALTLARRGQKDALPRALEVFRELPDEANMRGMDRVPHGNLQKRVLVLLSNAAREGNAPQPSLPDEERRHMDYLRTWWKQYGDTVVLRDPWLKVLEKQKVD